MKVVSFVGCFMGRILTYAEQWQCRGLKQGSPVENLRQQTGQTEQEDGEYYVALPEEHLTGRQALDR